MPALSRWFIKTSFIYLFASLFAAFILAAQKVWELPDFILALSPIYLHLFLVGWVTQFIFGIAIWMFPKFSSEKPHGNRTLGWATYVMLNLGLLLRLISEPLLPLRLKPWWGWFLAASAILQWLAGLAFIANIWGRVKRK